MTNENTNTNTNPLAALVDTFATYGECREMLESIPNAILGFDADKLDDSARIGIVPVGRREKVDGENKVVNFNALAFLAPTLEDFLAHPDGESYLQRLVDMDVRRKASNCVREEAETLSGYHAAIPASVARIIEGGQRATSGMEGFNKIAAGYVKMLREKGGRLATITKDTLRMALADATFAAGFVRNQGFWGAVIAKMAATAEAEGLPTSCYVDWLATRDEVEDSAMDDVALD